MENLKKHLLMAATMGLIAEQNKMFSDIKEKPLRIRHSGEEHNSLHHTKKQRKTRNNRRRIAAKSRAYNRRNN